MAMINSANKQATILDVARVAGVSHQTVSRVINEHPHVSSKTRERVHAVIRKLGYQPNRMARGLVTSSSRTIGIVSFGVSYFGPAQMLVNIEAAIRESGYDLTFATIDAFNFGALQRAIHKLSGGMVDGIVVIAPLIGLEVEEISSLYRDLPMIMTDVQMGAKVPSVILNQQEGSRLATQHLIDLGHRCVAGISGPLSWNDAALRHEGWLETVRRAGLVPGPHAAGDWTAQSGYAAATALLDTATPFTGLVVGNDQMALGALRALAEHGLAVPKDVSVVGFDNIPESAFFSPPLTTIYQDFGAMGQQSVEYLLSLIENPEMSIHQRVLHPKLVARSSTASPSNSSPSND